MPPIDLSALQQALWQTAEAKGFHVTLNPLNVRLQTLVRLALAHTEVSEAQESIGHDKIVEELADTAIRLMEMCWCCGIALTVTPAGCAYHWTNISPQLGVLHARISRITQEIKRYGITPQLGPLTEDALACCWDLAQSLGADLEDAIRAKDGVNRGRGWQYGTPGEGT